MDLKKIVKTVTVIMFASIFSCGSSDPESKYILSFLIDDEVGIVSETEVLVVMPYGSNLTSLTPTIILPEGNTVSPESGVAQDFTSPVTYTVTAEDDSIKEYSVTATVYEVGDTGPAGGIIFYCDANYGTYFEAAPSDQPGTSVWSNINNSEIGGDAQGSAIGTGASNTTAIINQFGHTSSSAKKCFDLNLGGKSDWFLPSYRELEELYTNKTTIGGFADAVYWSSTEVDPTDAAGYDFLNGAGGGSPKSTATFHVRCIRKF